MKSILFSDEELEENYNTAILSLKTYYSGYISFCKNGWPLVSRIMIDGAKSILQTDQRGIF